MVSSRCFLVAIFAGALPAISAERAMAPSGWFGNVNLAGERSFEAGKVVVATVRISDSDAELRSMVVAYGAPTKLPAAKDDLRVEVVSTTGDVRYQRGVPDPRDVIVEEEGNVRLPEAFLTLRVPFFPDASKLRLLDRAGKKILEANIAASVTQFCDRNTRDPDCGRTTPQY